MEAVGKLLETILMHYERKDYVSAEKLLDNLLISHPNFHRAWLREILSRIIIPSGFMVFLIVGAVMMIKRGEIALSLVVIASAVFCMFWLKRDAGQAVQNWPCP